MSMPNNADSLICKKQGQCEKNICTWFNKKWLQRYDLIKRPKNFWFLFSESLWLVDGLLPQVHTSKPYLISRFPCHFHRTKPHLYQLFHSSSTTASRHCTDDLHQQSGHQLQHLLSPCQRNPSFPLCLQFYVPFLEIYSWSISYVTVLMCQKSYFAKHPNVMRDNLSWTNMTNWNQSNPKHKQSIICSLRRQEIKRFISIKKCSYVLYICLLSVSIKMASF